MSRFYIESIKISPSGKKSTTYMAHRDSKFMFIGSDGDGWTGLHFSTRERAASFFKNYLEAISPESKIFYCLDDKYFYKESGESVIYKTSFKTTEGLI